MSELEGLLAGMRAREFKSELDVRKSGGQLGIMHERNRILEEQVATLQHQVTALQQSRDVQDRELSRLRTEAMALAQKAATASNARSSSSRGSSGNGGGSGSSRKDGGRHAVEAQADLSATVADQVWIACWIFMYCVARQGFAVLWHTKQACLKTTHVIQLLALCMQAATINRMQTECVELSQRVQHLETERSDLTRQLREARHQVDLVLAAVFVLKWLAALSDCSKHAVVVNPVHLTGDVAFVQ